MAAALGDLIQIVDEQIVLEQLVLNVYYYRVTSITGLGVGYLEAMSDWFQANVIEAVRQEQTTITNHRLVSVRNLSNGVDLLDDAIDIDGVVSATEDTSAPSYVSLGFKLIRESLVTRNGYKRIAGLADTRLAGNNYDFETGSQEGIEEALAADMVIGAITVAEPVIVKRPIGSPPVGAYQYSSIGAAQFTQLGTQNTRKRGRGV